MASPACQIAPRYDAILSDVWGVVHNGVAAHPDAPSRRCVELPQARAAGWCSSPTRRVPPRPSSTCSTASGITRDAYDAMVSSGDATRAILAADIAARRCTMSARPMRTTRCSRASTSPWAPPRPPAPSSSPISTTMTKRPTMYDDRIRTWLSRNLPMICANPDRVVEHGDRIDLLRRRARRSLRGAWRHGPDGRQALPPDLRRGAAPRPSSPPAARSTAPASSPSATRPHRRHRRRQCRARPAVHHRLDPCRRTRRLRQRPTPPAIAPWWRPATPTSPASWPGWLVAAAWGRSAASAYPLPAPSPCNRAAFLPYRLHLSRAGSNCPAFIRLAGLDQVPPSLKGAMVAIGNFDGCHRGHQQVFGR